MKKNKAWIVTVNMGYGHQRTAHPLRKIAFQGKVINANSYQGIPEKDEKIWESTRGFYEFISRFKRVPLFGNIAFSFYDKFQQIPSFYPKRDLSKPTFPIKKIFSFIEKGWGQDLVLRIRKEQLPLITTFFVPAFMAEAFNYPGEIFCVICDADIARSWVSLNPQKSRIKYLVPNSWTKDRLKLYGVKEENIFLTGFPLPVEDIGSEKLEIVRNDFSYRILNLDPERKYRNKYKVLIEKHIGILPEKPNHVLTILFSIGGAGAQKEIAVNFVKNLAEKIKKGEIRIILSAGIREKVRDYFLDKIKKLGLEKSLGKNIEIVFEKEINDYFEKFNQKLKQTDILWTKPSELSFYSGLGLPILIAPSIGSQEDFNRKWLLRIGAGLVQENPRYVKQWLFDYLRSGRFAEAAMDGFIEVEKLGVYNIERVIAGKI